jgi:hypothetical protein
MGSFSWPLGAPFSSLWLQTISSKVSGIAPAVATWIVTGVPRTTRTPLGFTSNSVLDGGRWSNGRVSKLNVSPTQDGLNSTMAKTGTNNASGRRLD